MTYRPYSLSLLCLVLVAASLFHSNPDHFLADDAYFYPQIASEIVLGHGSTFHQYSETNGYQPLWMAVAVGAAWVAQGDKMLLLHLLGAAQFLLFLVAIYFLFRIAQIATLQFYSVGVAFLCALMLAVGGLRLFESHLAIALQMAGLYWFLILWRKEKTVLELSLCSALLGLIFLARTDAFFFSCLFGMAMGVKVLGESSTIRVKMMSIFALAVPAVAIAALYMGVNQAAFGHPVPISGVIKSSFPLVHVDWNALGEQGIYIVSSALLFLFVAMVLSYSQKDLFSLFGVCFGSVLLHAIYLISFSWGSQWHFTTAFTIYPVCLMYLLTVMSKAVSFSEVFSRVVCGATLSFLVFITAVGVAKTQYSFSFSHWLLRRQSLAEAPQKSPRIQLVEDINRQLEPGVGVAVFDSPGVLAYFTHARILPVDGLVNDRAYDEWIADRGFSSYLNHNNIQYFIGPTLPEGEEYRSATLHATRQGSVQTHTVYAPIQKKCGGGILLEDSRVVFESSNPVPGRHNFHSVSCWRLE